MLQPTASKPVGGPTSVEVGEPVDRFLRDMTKFDPFQSFFSIGRKKKEKMDWVEPQSH